MRRKRSNHPDQFCFGCKAKHKEIHNCVFILGKKTLFSCCLKKENIEVLSELKSCNTAKQVSTDGQFFKKIINYEIQ